MAACLHLKALNQGGHHLLSLKYTSRCTRHSLCKRHNCSANLLLQQTASLSTVAE